MGNKALGKYLRTLRDGQGLTLEETERGSSIVLKTIQRWEAGLHEPRSSNLRPLLKFLQGDEQEADRILSGGDRLIDEQVAISLAEDRLRKRNINPLQIDKAYNLIRRLQNHPDQFAQWLGYGDRLLHELNDNAQ